MSFQLICDNCGTSVMMKDHEPCHRIPTNWETQYQSAKNDDVTKHHCPDCAMAKDQVRMRMQEETRKAQEEALAARRK